MFSFSILITLYRSITTIYYYRSSSSSSSSLTSSDLFSTAKLPIANYQRSTDKCLKPRSKPCTHKYMSVGECGRYAHLIKKKRAVSCYVIFVRYAFASTLKIRCVFGVCLKMHIQRIITTSIIIIIIINRKIRMANMLSCIITFQIMNKLNVDQIRRILISFLARWNLRNYFQKMHLSVITSIRSSLTTFISFFPFFLTMSVSREHRDRIQYMLRCRGWYQSKFKLCANEEWSWQSNPIAAVDKSESRKKCWQCGVRERTNCIDPRGTELKWRVILPLQCFSWMTVRGMCHTFDYVTRGKNTIPILFVFGF